MIDMDKVIPQGIAEYKKQNIQLEIGKGIVRIETDKPFDKQEMIVHQLKSINGDLVTALDVNNQEKQFPTNNVYYAKKLLDICHNIAVYGFHNKDVMVVEL